MKSETGDAHGQCADGAFRDCPQSPPCGLTDTAHMVLHTARPGLVRQRARHWDCKRNFYNARVVPVRILMAPRAFLAAIALALMAAFANARFLRCRHECNSNYRVLCQLHAYTQPTAMPSVALACDIWVYISATSLSSGTDHSIFVSEACSSPSTKISIEKDCASSSLTFRSPTCTTLLHPC